jgi:hypothetical protein
MTQLKGPFAKPNRRRGVVIAAKILLSAVVLGGIFILALSNQRCYELLHGLSRIECHPSNVSAATLEVIVEQTLKGAFAGRCERPLHDCVLYVEAAVKKSNEQCTSTTLPNQPSVKFEIQEKAYCDASTVGFIESEKLGQ